MLLWDGFDSHRLDHLLLFQLLRRDVLVPARFAFLVFFIFIANPVATHALMKAADEAGVKPWKVGKKKMSRGEKIFGMTVTFVILFLFWILLSPDSFDAFHLIAGVICCGIVTLMSHDLLVGGSDEEFIVKSLRLFRYIPWEFWQIVLANIDVRAYRVLHPKMPIDPLIIEFETPLRSDFSLVTLANSITLTPGTITISVEPEKGTFRVHAIAKEPADALLVDQTMQKKVAEVFFVEWPGTDQPSKVSSEERERS